MVVGSSSGGSIAHNGMVTAAHPLAAQAGIAIMKKGGNAIDAAVATGFALTVVDPSNCGIAGRGEMNLYLADEGRVYTIEFIAACGELARSDMFDVLPREPNSWWTVKDDANKLGYQSIAIPTVLSGLCTAQEQFGDLELRDVLMPAITLANDGFTVDSLLEASIDTNFENLMRFPATAAIFCPQGRPIMRGETLYMKDYARTLRQIAVEGPTVFYNGYLTDIIIQDLEEHGGLITARDLSTYRAKVLDPLSVLYHDFEVISGAPHCSGGRLVLQSLNILENFDLSAMKVMSPTFIHVLVETFKQAFADRFAYEGDPDFTGVPEEGMLSKAYAQELSERISLKKAAVQVPPGDAWKYDATWNRSTTATTSRDVPGSRNTTHLCAADSAGNVVALTETLCGGFGSNVTIPGTGILMNNGMYWFNPLPGNSNSIQPGKRHIANMAATLVLRDGEPVVATGCAGGRRILTTVTEMLLNTLIFHMGVSAVAVPRFHIEDMEPIEIEQSFFSQIPLAYSIDRHLKAIGHSVTTLPRIGLGCMIMRDPDSGRLHGMAEPRLKRQGSLAKY